MKTGSAFGRRRRWSAIAASCCRSREEIPLLVFADRKMVRDATTGGGSQLRAAVPGSTYRANGVSQRQAARYLDHSIPYSRRAAPGTRFCRVRVGQRRWPWR